MSELDKLLSEVEENYGEWAIKKLIAIVKCQRDALESHHQVWSTNGICFAECSNTCKALAKSNAIAKGEA